MKYFSEVEVTNNTLERLQKVEKYGNIQSVFKHTANIISNDHTLYTLADETLNNGPNCLRVENLRIEDLKLEVNDEVCFEGDKLFIRNNVLIDYSSPKIVEYKRHEFPSKTNTLELKLLHLIHSDWYLHEDQRGNEHVFIKSVNEKLDELSLELEGSIKQKDKDQMITSLKKFIGLGVGLTPSGDDFLTGLAYVASLENYPNNDLLVVLKSISDDMRKLTNIISFQQFEMALKGEVRSEVVQTLNAILNKEPYELIESHIRTILDIGSTSGFDTLRGMVFALKICL